MKYVVEKTGIPYDPNRLVITWARRIAGYKRMDGLFEDVARLKSIIEKTGKEVQIIISGRAHAVDQTAKESLQKVIKYMQKELAGYALYIPNYNMDVALKLTKGSDLWINTPIIGQEASGTSGMKAATNGVLQCTVQDGWAAEVDWYGAGWTLDSDQLAETLYFRLEEDIIPEFYNRNHEGVPEMWLAKMKKTLKIAEQFSAKRMLDEYQVKLYESRME